MDHDTDVDVAVLKVHGLPRFAVRWKWGGVSGGRPVGARSGVVRVGLRVGGLVRLLLWLGLLL